MNRRDALKSATALVGGALAASGILSACESAARDAAARNDVALAGDARSAIRVLDRADQDLVEEIADTILPSTAASPGAKAAGVGATVNLILSECFEAAAQHRVVNGLKQFRVTCRQRGIGDFAAAPRADRERLLRELDAESRRADSHYFALLRELSEAAYFSSEIGLTRSLRYVMVPGRYDGCVPLTPGQRAWG